MVGCWSDISNCHSSWICSIQCVPKKGGMIVVPNEKNELILIRLVTGWRVCMDYKKLNAWTEKDHFPMPSWIRCWIDLQERGGTVFLILIQVIIRFLMHWKIKIKPLLLFLIEPSHSREYCLGYVMHRPRLRDV